MRIEPYTTADADGVLAMLADHVDYAPEQVTEDTPKDDIAFFEDAFVHENDGIIAYTLKDESTIKGFMTLSRQAAGASSTSWYITALFVKHNHLSDDYAISMINLFCDLLSDTDDVCVAVHPTATQIVQFWRRNGFEFCPTRSVFTNADGERLMICRRKTL